MTIKIYPPPYLKNLPVNEKGLLEIEEGLTLKDLFKLLKIPFPRGIIHLCRVNYEREKLEYKLKDGDIVSFYSLISGG